jgi:YHS domain-containing protein
VIRLVLYFIYGLIVLLAVRMVMRAVGRLFGVQDQRRQARRTRRPEPRLAEDLVRDPVCQTYVPRSRALPATVEGREEFFCSEECRERARATVASAS